MIKRGRKQYSLVISLAIVKWWHPITALYNFSRTQNWYNYLGNAWGKIIKI